jgi:PPOX class probable F420-dependent enzyme
LSSNERKIELKAESIPDQYLDLFEKRAFGFLATLMPDGSPQVTPVWIDFDGQYIMVNSARGRQKDRNIQRDNRVALVVQGPDDPYRYVQIRGRVVEITEQSAEIGIDRLARKYLGEDTYPNRRSGEIRVWYKIEPEHVSGHG